MPKHVLKNSCPFYSKSNLPFLTNAGREMEERCIIKNPNVSSPSKVLVLFLDAENVKSMNENILAIYCQICEHHHRNLNSCVDILL